MAAQWQGKFPAEQVVPHLAKSRLIPNGEQRFLVDIPERMLSQVIVGTDHFPPIGDRNFVTDIKAAAQSFFSA